MCLHLCKNEHFLFLIRSLFKFSSDWCLPMVCRRKMRHHEDLTFHIWASINNIFLKPFNPPCCQLACYLTPVSAVRQQSHHSAMEGKHDVDTGNLESQMTLCASEASCMLPPFQKAFYPAQLFCIFFVSARLCTAIPYRWLRKPFFSPLHFRGHTHTTKEKTSCWNDVIKKSKEKKKRSVLGRAGSAQRDLWTRRMSFGS